MSRTLSVVVPVFHNARSLPALLERLDRVREEVAALDVRLELVFVDDGSRDDSLEVLRTLRRSRPEMTILKLSRNFGSMAAIKAGASVLTGDCFLFLAADLQDPPELIPEMLRSWLAGSKFVICTRRSRGDPLLSRAFAWVYYRLLRLLAVPDYPSGGFDLALMDRQLLAPFLRSGKTSYGLVFLYWLGYRPTVIGYDRAERRHGRSMWSFSKRLTAALDVLLGFSVMPIRMISGVGLLVATASFSYGVFQVARAFLGHTEVAGFATVVSLVAFLVGLVIVMLGLVGEYLWRVLAEVNARPEFVVDCVEGPETSLPEGGGRR